jgi:hypothetical protein
LATCTCGLAVTAGAATKANACGFHRPGQTFALETQEHESRLFNIFVAAPAKVARLVDDLSRMKAVILPRRRSSLIRPIGRRARHERRAVGLVARNERIGKQPRVARTANAIEWVTPGHGEHFVIVERMLSPPPPDVALPTKELTRKVLPDLPTRERQVIEQRWLADEPETLSRLGVVSGISQERVRQLETCAMRRMRAQRAWFVEDSANSAVV